MKISSRQYRHNNHSVGSAIVHLVWIPKRRKTVFGSDVKARLSQILTEVANEKRWLLKCLEIAPDHVHLLVEYDPSTPINSIVKAFKVVRLDILDRSSLIFLSCLPCGHMPTFMTLLAK